jgi:hypothetical protein
VPLFTQLRFGGKSARIEEEFPKTTLERGESCEARRGRWQCLAMAHNQRVGVSDRRAQGLAP